MPVHYRSEDEDSRRWDAFGFRDRDIVVSTRSKHGTTWVQSILLHLVHGPDGLPDRLAVLSPWLDARFEPLETVLARLTAQQHRRVVKTHTPLDGLPLDPRATWVVVARDPLDAAVSLYHQGENLDRARMRELTATNDRTSPQPGSPSTPPAPSASPPSPAPPPPPSPPAPRPPVDEWLRSWATERADPVSSMDSLDGVLHHYADAWQRRRDTNVVLVHFNDLLADLGGEVARLAAATDMEVGRDRVDEVVAVSTFGAMRQRATQLAPDPSDVLLDRAAFFRRGAPGAGRELLDDDELAAYHARVRAQAPSDLAAWLLRA